MLIIYRKYRVPIIPHKINTIAFTNFMLSHDFSLTVFESPDLTQFPDFPESATILIMKWKK